MSISEQESQQIFDSAAESYSVSKEQDVIRRLPSKLQRVQKVAKSSGVIALFVDNVSLLYGMMTAKGFSLTLKTKAMIIAALAYFVVPTDLTPDFIPFIGYIDDSIVMTTLIKRISSEIDRFRQWKTDILS